MISELHFGIIQYQHQEPQHTHRIAVHLIEKPQGEPLDILV